MLTIAYLTCRRDPKLDWFVDSLNLQTGGDYAGIEVIVVDFYAGEIKRRLPPGASHVKPKPNVWQGIHRLTREDWFAAGNARNTALCLAPGEWIAYVDDLSVLVPGWLVAAREATGRPNVITCGAYRKVNNLDVRTGSVASYQQFAADNRMAALPTHEQPPYPCSGHWMYGSSLVAPVEALLKINGWCEDLCGGLGFEDCITGIVLQKSGVHFKYDTRMMTFESEEHHHIESPIRRSDKGVSPNDKSHAALGASYTLERFDNHFDLRDMRRRVLAGEPFPIPTTPTHDWYDGQPLGEM